MKKYIHKQYINKKVWHAFEGWLPLAVGLTMLTVLLHVSGYVIIRSLANDIQIQLVDDVARYLERGADTRMFNSQLPVPIESSRTAYVVLYDLNKTPISGFGLLHGELPRLPDGVFEHTKKVGEHRVTWEPERGLRQAVVLRYQEGVNPGYIMAGRSLSDTDARIRALGGFIALTWSLIMLATFGMASLFARA
jgi:hypothetical protein